VLQMLDAVERLGDPDRYVADVLDRGERIPGFGHRIYRAEDPRARALRRIAEQLGSPRLQVAAELERAALAALAERKPDRVLATNVEYWSAVILDHAQVPQSLFTPLFACARMAGWSAHILEQRRSGRLVRPAALYVGEAERRLTLAS
jgi:citrate synthase